MLNFKQSCTFLFLFSLSYSLALEWKEFTDKEDSDVHIFYEPEPSVFNGCGCRDGQPGQPGRNGRDGQSIVGPPGRDGVNGRNGRDGKDGPKGEKGDPGVPGKVNTQELNDLKARVNTLTSTITAVEKGSKTEIQKVKDTFELQIKYLKQLIKEVNATKSQTPGPPGPEGPRGARGPPGIKGNDGSHGKTGAQGPRGPQGVRGVQGPSGKTGAQGSRGEQGPRGPPGQDCANTLQQCRFKTNRKGLRQKYDRYVYVYAKASENYQIIGGSCSTHKAAESSLYRLENGEYTCACTGKTKAKYSLRPRSPRLQYDDDDDDDDDHKEYRDCIINYWECPIV